MSIRPYKIEIYQSVGKLCSTQLWYWRMRSPNGRIVADGSEAYTSKTGATRAARAIASSDIVVIKG